MDVMEIFGFINILKTLFPYAIDLTWTRSVLQVITLTERIIINFNTCFGTFVNVHGLQGKK